jgi:dihydropyrimidinase
MDHLARARLRGVRAFGEALHGHLCIDDSQYYNKDWDIAAAHVMSPPFRPKKHQDALWRGLASGVLQTTATDHCVFTKKQKRMGLSDFTKIPNGCAGVEERLMLIWNFGVNTKKITPEQFVAVTSTNSSKIFGLYPRKGLLAVGSDADIVVWDPKGEKTLSEKTHFSKIDISIFEGMKMIGIPIITVLRGQVVFENNQVIANKGNGAYISRKPFAPYVWGSDGLGVPKVAPIKVERDVKPL